MAVKKLQTIKLEGDPRYQLESRRRDKTFFEPDSGTMGGENSLQRRNAGGGRNATRGKGPSPCPCGIQAQRRGKDEPMNEW